MKKIIILLLFIGVCAAVNASKIDTLSVATKFLSSPEGVVVITPDMAAEKRLPVVYLLNGYSGNQFTWINIRRNLPELSDQYGIIFVMPDGRDSWYWDSPLDSAMQMESFITQDLVPYIDANYNTIPNPSKRAITGLSMGGHGAMWLGFRHPEIWKNIGSTSGGLDIRPFPENWNLKLHLGEKTENEETWNSHTVINLVEDITPGYYNIIIDCGTDDFFLNVNYNMHDALMNSKIEHDYTLRPGGHTQDYWENSILYQLLFFNENFKRDLPD